MTGGPAGGGPSRRALALAVALGTSVPPYHLTAQVAVHVSAGVRYTSTLVHDSIVTPFVVRPALAPAVALTAAAPPTRGWSPEATLDFSWSTLERHDQNGTTVGLGTLSTLAFEVGLRRRLAAGLSGGIGVGGLKYLPADETGIFRSGGGAPYPLGMAAVSYAPAFGAHWGLALEARYDLHGFITPALRDEGFNSRRAVHRIAVAVRANWLGSR